MVKKQLFKGKKGNAALLTIIGLPVFYFLVQAGVFTGFFVYLTANPLIFLVIVIFFLAWLASGQKSPRRRR